VTAGYICEEPRKEFYGHMDAANVDLKAFTEDFYHKVCGAHLQDVLDTLVYLKRETDVWVEITNLIIPGENDSPKELDEMTSWVVENLGPDVPMHFSAFHPDWKMQEKTRTPWRTLIRAREIARKNGVRFAYTGNVQDSDGQTTYCVNCGAGLIVRAGYELLGWNLTSDGKCASCATTCPGHFDGPPGEWGARYVRVGIRDYA
jgi:pyruvate formate lyase activating enzyme